MLEKAVDTTALENVTGRIVVVDDDVDMQMLLRTILQQQGHVVHTFSSAAQVIQGITSGQFDGPIDLILSDINMPGMDGITFVKSVQELNPQLPVVLITAYGSIESAVQAIKQGAADYIAKPFKAETVRVLVSRMLRQKILAQQEGFTHNESSPAVGEMIGRSREMQGVFNLIRKVSKSTSNVLILGESGTGKEMVARAIHNEGPRADKPFVAINCAAIPESLLESELFGHAKGSFTGAVSQKKGLFEEAHGGTFFLDEIADMNIALQAKLLRVIQERKIRPVGQNTYRPIDVRFIAATHKDLSTMIARGTFREDLYYRLSVIPIIIPPLRDRPEDIMLFAEHFMKKFAAANGSHVVGFTKAAMNKLLSMPWEGNVRQLENTIERAIILCEDAWIDEHHISNVQLKYGAVVHAPPETETLSFREMERRCLQAALEKANGRKEKAAQILGISRKTLYRKEREYGLVARH